MDINITSPLTATINLTQIESYWSVLKYVGLYGATGVAALLGAYLQGRYTLKLEKEKTNNLKKQKQWEVFSRLKGIQAILPQDYITYYTKIVAFISQESAARLFVERENQDLHLKEAGKISAYSDEISRLFAKDRQDLYEIIGLILALFPDDPELHKKIDPIYSQLTPFEQEFNKEKLINEMNIMIPNIYSDLETWSKTFDATKIETWSKQVVDWRNKKSSRIVALAHSVIFVQLDELLNYLLPKVK